jgi:hypothetical protein
MIKVNLFLKIIILSIVFLWLLPFKTSSQVNKDSADVKFENLKNLTDKGSWMTGGTLALQLKNTSGKNQLIRYVEEDNNYEFAVNIYGAYAFADQNFAGLSLLYGQSKSDGTYENSDGQLYNEQFFGNQYSFRPFLKNLTPLDKKGRFNIVTQIEFWNQIDQGITQTIINEEVTRKQSVKYTGLLGVRPGISVFVLQNVAFETTLNVAGVKYSYEKNTTTNLPDSKTTTASVDFKIDILQLNIGIFVYLK